MKGKIPARKVKDKDWKCQKQRAWFKNYGISGGRGKKEIA